jgi:hypothetical protein
MSIDSSDAPVLSSTNKTFPGRAAVDGFVDTAFFRAAVQRALRCDQTIFGFFGSTTMREMCCVASSPIFFHVLPASVDL